MNAVNDNRLQIAVILGSTREGRFAPVVASWLVTEAAQRDDMIVDLVDPIETPLPTVLPVLGQPPADPGAKELLAAVSPRLAAAEGFVVITPEYNHSFPAVLKNVIDWHSAEWCAKPVAFVSYGGVSGGVRAVEHLRGVFAELHAVTIRDSVSFAGVWSRFDAAGKTTDPASASAAKTMLDRLAWWAHALRDARAVRPYNGGYRRAAINKGSSVPRGTKAGQHDDASAETSMATPATVPRVIPFDHGVVVTSRWQVAGRRAQRAAADTAMARWQRVPWPDGCRSIACFLSTDGQIILFYGQWSDERDYQRHVVRSAGLEAVDRVESLDPSVTHLDSIISRLAGPPSIRSDDGPFPGCVALVTIRTDGPDRQRQAAERIAAVASGAHPGGVGGHMLFSVDGAHVILYAEWTSEEAHREAVAGHAFGGPRGIFDDCPGIEGLSVHRYQLYRSITSPGRSHREYSRSVQKGLDQRLGPR